MPDLRTLLAISNALAERAHGSAVSLRATASRPGYNVQIAPPASHFTKTSKPGGRLANRPSPGEISPLNIKPTGSGQCCAVADLVLAVNCGIVEKTRCS